jgi:hypothetical protein
MRMMQASSVEEVQVIAMRDDLMLLGIVPAAGTFRRLANGWILLADSNHMLIIVVTVGMVQVAFVQIVHMPLVHDLGMPTAAAVLMRMRFMRRMRHCFRSSFIA